MSKWFGDAQKLGKLQDLKTAGTLGRGSCLSMCPCPTDAARVSRRPWLSHGGLLNLRRIREVELFIDVPVSNLSGEAQKLVKP